MQYCLHFTWVLSLWFCTSGTFNGAQICIWAYLFYTLQRILYNKYHTGFPDKDELNQKEVKVNSASITEKTQEDKRKVRQMFVLTSQRALHVLILQVWTEGCSPQKQTLSTSVTREKHQNIIYIWLNPAQNETTATELNITFSCIKVTSTAPGLIIQQDILEEFPAVENVQTVFDPLVRSSTAVWQKQQSWCDDAHRCGRLWSYTLWEQVWVNRQLSGKVNRNWFSPQGSAPRSKLHSQSTYTWKHLSTVCL